MLYYLPIWKKVLKASSPHFFVVRLSSSGKWIKTLETSWVEVIFKLLKKNIVTAWTSPKILKITVINVGTYRI